MRRKYKQPKKSKTKAWAFLAKEGNFDRDTKKHMAGKHQKDKEARMTKGQIKSNKTLEELMKIQRDNAVIGNIADRLRGAQQLGMATGGKMNYNMAGMLPGAGAVQGLMGTAAMATQGGFKDMPWQNTAGRILQGASGLANLIPTAGPLLGMGMNLVGGALQTMAPPIMTNPESINQNPLGMFTGGQMPAQQTQLGGGKLQPLSNNAVEVKANNPGMTDSVDAGNVNLDNDEVLVDNKVFSNTLVNPGTGNTFADDEKATQTAQGKFEKYQVNTGDTEMKDGKYHKKNTENLFNSQEELAKSLGLRNQDGTPVQIPGISEGMSDGMLFGGNISQQFMKSGTQGPPKAAYATGGKLGYDNGGPLPWWNTPPSAFDINSNYLTGDEASQGITFLPFAEDPFDPTSKTRMTAQWGDLNQETPALTEAPGINPDPVKYNTAKLRSNQIRSNQIRPITTTGVTNWQKAPTVDSGIPGQQPYIPGVITVGSDTGTYDKPKPIPGLTMPQGTGNTMINFSGQPMSTPTTLGPQFNTGINLPTGSFVSGAPTPPDPYANAPILPVPPSRTSTVTELPYENAPTLNTPSPYTKDAVTREDLKQERNQQLLEDFKGENPYGERATQWGDAIAGMSLLANRPFYVNYGNVGQEEINQQNIALARARGGEQSAINDILAQQKAARQRAGGRNFQTLQANLANLSTRTGQAMAKTRGQFARQEAQMRQQIGSRRTAIEAQNLATQKYQDDINTREYDTLHKENLKAMTNFRNMQLERQLAFNKFRRNKDLMSMLESKNFKWDDNTRSIIMKTILKSDI